MNEKEYDKSPEDFRQELLNAGMPQSWQNYLWALNQAVTGEGTKFLKEIKSYAVSLDGEQK